MESKPLSMRNQSLGKRKRWKRQKRLRNLAILRRMPKKSHRIRQRAKNPFTHVARGRRRRKKRGSLMKPESLTKQSRWENSKRSWKSQKQNAKRKRPNSQKNSIVSKRRRKIYLRITVCYLLIIIFSKGGMTSKIPVKQIRYRTSKRNWKRLKQTVGFKSELKTFLNTIKDMPVSNTRSSQLSERTRSPSLQRRRQTWQGNLTATFNSHNFLKT